VEPGEPEDLEKPHEPGKQQELEKFEADDLERLEHEAHELAERAKTRAKEHRTSRGRYGSLDWTFGFLGVVFAVAAGTTALIDKDHPELTAGVAFAAAFVTGLQTFARFAEREQSHRERMADQSRVTDNARVLETIELHRLSRDDGIRRLKELQESFHAVDGRPTFSKQ
jgi:hypothetical protein